MADAERDLLVVSVVDLDYYIAQLEVRANAAGFAGAMRTYSWDAEQFRRFASDSRLYPISEEHRPTLAFGYLDRSTGQLSSEVVRIEIRPAGMRGQLAVDVWLRASGADLITAEDRPDAEFEVKLTILTTYERLRQFAAQLDQLADAHPVVAELMGELLA